MNKLTNEQIDRLFWFDVTYKLCQTLLIDLLEQKVPIRNVLQVVHMFAYFYLPSKELQIKSYLKDDNKLQHLSQHDLDLADDVFKLGEYEVIKRELFNPYLEENND